MPHGTPQKDALPRPIRELETLLRLREKALARMAQDEAAVARRS